LPGVGLTGAGSRRGVRSTTGGVGAGAGLGLLGAFGWTGAGEGAGLGLPGAFGWTGTGAGCRNRGELGQVRPVAEPVGFEGVFGCMAPTGATGAGVGRHTRPLFTFHAPELSRR
jgi:hypothetical protein